MNQSDHDPKYPRTILNPYPNPYPAFPRCLGAQALLFYSSFPDTESKSSVVISYIRVWSLQQVHKLLQGRDHVFNLISFQSIVFNVISVYEMTICMSRKCIYSPLNLARQKCMIFLLIFKCPFLPRVHMTCLKQFNHKHFLEYLALQQTLFSG